MASPTKVHKRRKVLKGLASGKWRKNRNANLGTTAPDLALTKPNANETAQKAARAAGPSKGKLVAKSVKKTAKAAAPKKAPPKAKA